MSTHVPPSLKSLLDSPREEVRSDVELLAELVALTGDMRVEVEGVSVALPDTIRAVLARVVDHLQRSDSIRRALAGEPPQMLFQPIVNLVTGDVSGHEALTVLPDNGTRTTESWFKEAAQLEMGEEFELAMVEQALRNLPDLPAPGYLSINVSPATATSPNLSRLLRGTAGPRVVLEITEHARVTDYAALMAALSLLRARGIRLAVDDAGAGFASLHHILLMRPEIVKLDVSLIRDIDTDLARQALVSGLTFFTSHINATAVAEGVESRAQADTLRRLGVRDGQGWYLGTPGELGG